MTREFPVLPLGETNNHIIFASGAKRVLVDTGAGTSVSDESAWSFMGQPRPLISRYLGADCDRISQLVGTRVDILMGNDIFKDLDFRIDLDQLKIVFSSELLDGPGEMLPGQAWVLDGSIKGRSVRTLVDTGAKLSYLSRKVAVWADLQEVGQARDFWPPYGKFETPIFNCTLNLGNRKAEFPVGILPVEVDRGLFHLADAFIGVDLLKLGAMTFSLRSGHLIADWACEAAQASDRPPAPEAFLPREDLRTSPVGAGLKITPALT